MVWTEIRLKKHITVPLTWLDLTRFTFRGSEVSAGGGVSSCSVYVDCCYSELVPTTWAYISQPDTLLWGLHQKHRIQYKNKTEGTTWWWICEEKKPQNKTRMTYFKKESIDQSVNRRVDERIVDLHENSYQNIPFQVQSSTKRFHVGM